MPMLRAGSCEGEDCTYGVPVVACRDLTLLAADSLRAKQSGFVHRGDTVTLVTGNLRLFEPGIVLIKRDYAITNYSDGEGGTGRPRSDTLRFYAGDTLYVLDYLELGDWNWWYRGKAGSGAEFWTGPLQRVFEAGDDQRPAVSISKPRGEWWYKLQRDPRSEAGWIRASDSDRSEDWEFVRLHADATCGS